MSLLVSHSEDREKTQNFAGKSSCSKGEINNRLGEIGKEQTFPSKKAKLLRDSQESDVFPVRELLSNCDRPSKSGDGIVSGYDVASGREVPDVADTIEDLLEQTSKVSTICFFVQLFILLVIFSQFSPLVFCLDSRSEDSWDDFRKDCILTVGVRIQSFFSLSYQYLALFDSLMM